MRRTTSSGIRTRGRPRNTFCWERWGSVPVSTPQILCSERRVAMSAWIAFPIKGGWLCGRSECKIYRILILLRTVNVPNESCVIRYMDGYSGCHPSTRGRSEKEKGNLDQPYSCSTHTTTNPRTRIQGQKDFFHPVSTTTTIATTIIQPGSRKAATTETAPFRFP